MVVQFSKKKKFVADGVFKAELNEVLIQELAEDITPTRTEIITLVTRTQNVLDEKVWQIRELTAIVQKRFGFSEGKVELYAEKGVLGIKVKIMLPWEPAGKISPRKPLSDHMSIVEPKDEILSTTPISEQKSRKPEPPAMSQPVPTA
uniref:KH type-2 domain-containing protein n=1 Tax=Colobus angolensis palliatus TaxID=336983 RepID=A0A2K5IN53_COLAP